MEEAWPQEWLRRQKLWLSGKVHEMVRMWLEKASTLA